MLTKTELAKLSGGAIFHLTNQSFASLLLYIAKKEQLGNDKKSSNIIKFLMNKRKYVAMKEDLESGKLKTEDVWLDFGKYLGMEDYNIKLQERLVVEESMKVDERVEVGENKNSKVVEGEEKKGMVEGEETESKVEGEEKNGMVEGEESDEKVEQSSSGPVEQCSEGEMVRRVLEDTFLPSMVTNSLVIEVVKLHKKVKTLAASSAANFILRSLRLANESSIKWKVWDCMKYTTARVQGRWEELNQPWLYLDVVNSIAFDTASHPLD